MTLPRHLRAHATTRSGRFGLLLGCTMLTAAGFASSARAAEGWVGTATRAYLPAVLSPRAGEGAARTQFRTALNRASASAVAANAATPVTVSVALALRNEADLDRATAEIAAPGNANYGRFLSAAEFLAAYAPTQAQVDAVVTHLRASGFTDIAVAPNRLLVSATGRPAAVRAAFNTGLTQFSFEGRTVFANASAAQVPASLGGTVSAVLGLQTVSRPHTFHRVVPAAAAAPSRAAPDAVASTVAHNPTDFPKIYDVGSVATGAKTKVGIITWGSLTKVQSDLSTFAKNNGLAAISNTVVKTGSGTYAVDANSDGEWDLDSQTIAGTSGGVSQLIFYSAPNGNSSSSGLTDAAITAAYNRAVSDDAVKVINVSLGEDEDSAQSDGTQAADDKIFKVAQAQGQTFSVSSGDAGAYQSTNGTITDGQGNINVDLSDYSVSEPATSPYVVAVGGTTLSTTGTTTYGSEVTWNEGLAYADDYDDAERIWATGGGTSDYETAPTWQTTYLSSKPTKRLVPDIAFDAASASGAKIIVHGTTEQIGGTSLASPIFVGVWARLESAQNNALGFPAASFYKYLPGNAALRHDVTSGNNGYDGYGYKAGAGYDQVTGFGSLDIAKLAAFIASTSDFAR